MSGASAYLLQWPPGWPRTAQRLKGPYRSTLGSALNNLRSELRLLCGDAAAKSLVLSSNVTLGAERPTDPGVVAYFVWDGEASAIPCDRWALVEHNVQAIALTIEAMRAIDRHGAKHMVKAMFRGFQALPSPTASRPWRLVLGFGPGTRPGREMLDMHRRSLAKDAHPDADGSHEAMAEINAAYEEAKKELGYG